MADEAQAELIRYIGHRHNPRGHPEDEYSADDTETTEAQATAQQDEDSDFADEAPPFNPSKPATTVPYRREYANTGVKGVIADAQAFEAAKRATKQPHYSDSPDDLLDQLDSDDEFTQQWRQQRLGELQAQFTGPSTATVGSFTKVSASTYLDIVESASAAQTVVVMIWDYSEASEEIEDELKMLAYRCGRDVRFIGLRSDVAEVSCMSVPSLLIYRGGEVVGLLDGVRAEDVSAKLAGLGVVTR